MSAEFFRKLAATSYFRIGTSLRGAGAGFAPAGACASAGNTAPFRIATHATAAPRTATATMLRIERNDCLTRTSLHLTERLIDMAEFEVHSSPRQRPVRLLSVRSVRLEPHCTSSALPEDAAQSRRARLRAR